MHWIAWLFTPATSNENLRRQGILTMVASSGLSAVSLVLGIISVLTNKLTLSNSITFVALLILLACAVLARLGRVRVAGLIMVWFILLAIMLLVITSSSPVDTFFLVLPILLASIVLSSWQMLPIVVISIGLSLFAIRSGRAEDLSAYVAAFALLLMVAILGYLGAWTIERSWKQINVAQNETKRANTALQQANNELETRVALRTADLGRALDDLKRREAELQNTLGALQSSEATIRELSAPILPVLSGVLVAPLIGAIDTERAAIFTNNLLKQAERVRAQHVIIDITGVPIVDTQVAQVIMRAAGALRLLGVEVQLVGIRPEVAQTLVSLNVQFTGITTHSDLREAIQSLIKLNV